MLQDVIHPVIHPPEQQQQQQQQQLPIENITSPINAQMFEFDQDLFPEALQNSEVSSCSNCYDDNSSYTTNISFSSFPADIKFNPNTTTTTTTTNNNNINVDTITNNNLSIIFDSQDDTENNIAASINFLTSQTTFSVPPFITTQEDQFDLSSLQSQIPINDVENVNAFTFSPDPGIQLTGAPLAPSVFEDDCLPNLPSYVSLDPSSPSCSFLDPSIAPFLPGGNLNPGLSGDATGIFAGGILMASSELQPHELEFQGDNGGIFGTDPYTSSEIQVTNGLTRFYNAFVVPSTAFLCL